MFTDEYTTKNLTILCHMSALFPCKNNFSKMVKSVKNVLPHDAER